MAIILSGNGYNPSAAFNLFKYTATDYDELVLITGVKTGDFAYVFNSQGTAWLPGSLGGSYYPSGFYIYDGAVWKMDQTIRDIAQELANGSGAIIYSNSWSISGIYSTTSSSFGGIPEQIMVPRIIELLPSGTKIEAKLLVSTENSPGSTGEADVENYTDGGEIIGSVVDLPSGTWSDKISDSWFDLTAHEGKAIRVRIRRVTGSGMDATRIEGATLIFKVTK